MAKDKKTNIGKSLDVLRNELMTKKDELFRAKLEHARRKLKNTTSLTLMRKEIAKIFTAIKQQEAINVKVVAEKKEVKNG